METGTVLYLSFFRHSVDLLCRDRDQALPKVPWKHKEQEHLYGRARVLWLLSGSLGGGRIGGDLYAPPDKSVVASGLSVGGSDHCLAKCISVGPDVLSHAEGRQVVERRWLKPHAMHGNASERRKENRVCQ